MSRTTSGGAPGLGGGDEVSAVGLRDMLTMRCTKCGADRSEPKARWIQERAVRCRRCGGDEWFNPRLW